MNGMSERLFQFEDGSPIWFAVDKRVTNQDMLGRLIKENGGAVTETTNHADFCLVSSWKAETSAAATKLSAEGGVVVDTPWVFESVLTQRLLPWYPYQVHGLSCFQHLEDQDRDLREMAICLGRYRPIVSEDKDIYRFLHMKFPHRTSLQFAELHLQYESNINACALRLHLQYNEILPSDKFFNFGSEESQSVSGPQIVGEGKSDAQMALKTHNTAIQSSSQANLVPARGGDDVGHHPADNHKGTNAPVQEYNKDSTNGSYNSTSNNTVTEDPATLNNEAGTDVSLPVSVQPNNPVFFNSAARDIAGKMQSDLSFSFGSAIPSNGATRPTVVHPEAGDSLMQNMTPNSTNSKQKRGRKPVLQTESSWASVVRRRFTQLEVDTLVQWLKDHPISEVEDQANYWIDFARNSPVGPNRLPRVWRNYYTNHLFRRVSQQSQLSNTTEASHHKRTHSSISDTSLTMAETRQGHNELDRRYSLNIPLDTVIDPAPLIDATPSFDFRKPSHQTSGRNHFTTEEVEEMMKWIQTHPISTDQDLRKYWEDFAANSPLGQSHKARIWRSWYTRLIKPRLDGSSEDHVFESPIEIEEHTPVMESATNPLQEVGTYETENQAATMYVIPGATELTTTSSQLPNTPSTSREASNGPHLSPTGIAPQPQETLAVLSTLEAIADQASMREEMKIIGPTQWGDYYDSIHRMFVVKCSGIPGLNLDDIAVWNRFVKLHPLLRQDPNFWLNRYRYKFKYPTTVASPTLDSIITPARMKSVTPPTVPVPVANVTIVPASSTHISSEVSTNKQDVPNLVVNRLPNVQDKSMESKEDGLAVRKDSGDSSALVVPQVKRPDSDSKAGSGEEDDMDTGD